jgi:hypothetical protein
VTTFQLHIVNSDFTADGVFDADNVEAARKQALKGALQIGTDEICKGASFFGAEVHLGTDGELMERFLVSIGQSTLQ